VNDAEKADELAQAEADARLVGTGYLIDNRRVDPARVRVLSHQIEGKLRLQVSLKGGLIMNVALATEFPDDLWEEIWTVFRSIPSLDRMLRLEDVYVNAREVVMLRRLPHPGPLMPGEINLPEYRE